MTHTLRASLDRGCFWTGSARMTLWGQSPLALHDLLRCRVSGPCSESPSLNSFSVFWTSASGMHCHGYTATPPSL